MATKNNPGEFDCYTKAEPDEPMFVLLGRDRHAATLVSLWAQLRILDGEDPAVTAEAMDTAFAMADYARSRGKEPCSRADLLATASLLHVKRTQESLAEYLRRAQNLLRLSIKDQVGV